MRDLHSTPLGVRRLGRRSFVAFVAFGWLLAMGFAQSASAITLTAWDFAGNAGDEDEVAATSVEVPAFQATKIVRGGGFQDRDAVGGTFYNDSWPSNLDPGQYFEFSISPAFGTTYSLTDITFNIVRDVEGNYGPPTWWLRSDADGFLANVATFAFPDSATVISPTAMLPGTPEFQDLTGTRIFRLYGLQASNGGGGLGGVSGNDVAINGSLMQPTEPEPNPLPETLPFGVFGLTAAALFWVRSRIKR